MGVWRFFSLSSLFLFYLRVASSSRSQVAAGRSERSVARRITLFHWSVWRRPRVRVASGIVRGTTVQARAPRSIALGSERRAGRGGHAAAGGCCFADARAVLSTPRTGGATEGGTDKRFQRFLSLFFCFASDGLCGEEK